jgi:CRP/FNR family cyclic AMP-dependent transcriptional regulator
MNKGAKSAGFSARYLELLLRHVASNVAYLNLDEMLGPEDRQVIRLIPRLSTRLKFSTGEIVWPTEETRSSLVILWRGTINIFLRHRATRTFVKKIEPHSVFGNMTRSWSQMMLSSLAVAAEPCEVRVLDESAARRLLARSPKLKSRLDDVICARNVEMTTGYRDAQFDDVPSMLAKLLLAAADERGVVRLTHEEIADRLGVHRPTVWKAVRSMKRKGIIESKWRKITVLDREGLRELVIFPD